MNARGVLPLLFTLLSTAMLGLAAGAVWLVATMYLRQPLAWLALPFGILLAWAIRQGVCKPGPTAALMAALATLLAGFYVHVLTAGVLIAGNMGFGLLDALRTAGAGMLWQLAWLGISSTDASWFLGGAALAAFIARRPMQRPR